MTIRFPTPDEVALLRALEANATPGPWDGRWAPWSETFESPLNWQIGDATVNGSPSRDNGLVATACKKKDQVFIAAARNALPDLLAAYEERGAVIENLLPYASHFADRAEDYPRSEADAEIVRAKKAIGK